MNKELLLEIGLGEEQAERVMRELDGKYVPKARFNQVNTERKALETELEGQLGRLNALELSIGDVEALKEQVAALQAANQAKDEEYARQLKEVRLEQAVETALRSAGARNVAAARALLQLDPATELADDGTVDGLAEQIDALAGAADTAFLFERSSGGVFRGVNPGEPKDGVPGGGEPQTMAEAIRMKFESL